jgi:hypothetical protein
MALLIPMVTLPEVEIGTSVPNDKSCDTVNVEAAAQLSKKTNAAKIKIFFSIADRHSVGSGI